MLEQKPDSINQWLLKKKILRFSPFAVPGIIERLKDNRDVIFVEMAVDIFHKSKNDPSSRILGILNSIKDPHTCFLVCMRVYVRPKDTALPEPWADVWHQDMSGVFLRSYLNMAGRSPFLPDDKEKLEILLHAFILERAVYELGYELNNLPNPGNHPDQGN